MEEKNFGKFKVIRQVLLVQIYSYKFTQIRLQHWLLQIHVPFFPTRDDLSRGLLNHLQSTGWLKVLAVYFIDKQKESSL